MNKDKLKLHRVYRREIDRFRETENLLEGPVTAKYILVQDNIDKFLRVIPRFFK